jgi:FkbM family methyltransferase
MADGTYSLPLPWNLALRVTRLDDIGQGVDVLGVHDLVVTEAIWRLASPGDTLVDVGANVGYMSLVMMARLGRSGRVFSFEPQPGVFDELSANLDAAGRRLPGVTTNARFEALSDSEGTAMLWMPPDANRGLARLDPTGGVPVPTRRLDGYAAEFSPEVAVLKIDVEGHEPAVLRGAKGLLERGLVRNIVLEEHGTYPTESTTFLEGLGYTIFTLQRSLLRVVLGDPAAARRASWTAPSLLATRRPDDAARAFRPLGWFALSTRGD